MKTRSLLLAVAVVSSLFMPVGPAPAHDWTPTAAPFTNWTSVASSADGSRLAATALGLPGFIGISGSIYTSTNSGASWQSAKPANLHWTSVASSADGTKLFAVGRAPGDFVYPTPIWISTNSGATWTNTDIVNPWTQVWAAVATSADGSKVAAVDVDIFYLRPSAL